jgi:hypothetical protein
MNIFVTDLNPVLAAQNLCDSHIVKMSLESAQLLCTVHWVGWQKVLNPPDNLKGKALKMWIEERIPDENLIPQYSMTHVNHPSSKWARECSANYEWLVNHALAQCDEYEKRYGRVIKCKEIVEWAKLNKPQTFETSHLQMTPFAVAMPDIYKVDGDPVQSYRNYYHGAKASFAKWKYTTSPSWWSPNNYDIGGDHVKIKSDSAG